MPTRARWRPTSGAPGPNRFPPTFTSTWMLSARFSRIQTDSSCISKKGKTGKQSRSQTEGWKTRIHDKLSPNTRYDPITIRVHFNMSNVPIDFRNSKYFCLTQTRIKHNDSMKLLEDNESGAWICSREWRSWGRSSRTPPGTPDVPMKPLGR